MRGLKEALIGIRDKVLQVLTKPGPASDCGSGLGTKGTSNSSNEIQGCLREFRLAFALSQIRVLLSKSDIDL
jgi:hypothetical protein